MSKQQDQNPGQQTQNPGQKPGQQQGGGQKTGQQQQDPQRQGEKPGQQQGGRQVVSEPGVKRAPPGGGAFSLGAPPGGPVKVNKGFKLPPWSDAS